MEGFSHCGNIEGEDASCPSIPRPSTFPKSEEPTRMQASVQSLGARLADQITTPVSTEARYHDRNLCVDKPFREWMIGEPAVHAPQLAAAIADTDERPAVCNAQRHTATFASKHRRSTRPPPQRGTGQRRYKTGQARAIAQALQYSQQFGQTAKITSKTTHSQFGQNYDFKKAGNS